MQIGVQRGADAQTPDCLQRQYVETERDDSLLPSLWPDDSWYETIQLSLK